MLRRSEACFLWNRFHARSSRRWSFAWRIWHAFVAATKNRLANREKNDATMASVRSLVKQEAKRADARARNHRNAFSPSWESPRRTSDNPDAPRVRVTSARSPVSAQTGFAQRCFGGLVDSRNSSVCSTWTMRPAPGVRIRSSNCRVASRPISEVGWRTVVREG